MGDLTALSVLSTLGGTGASQPTGTVLEGDQIAPQLLEYTLQVRTLVAGGGRASSAAQKLPSGARAMPSGVPGRLSINTSSLPACM